MKNVKMFIKENKDVITGLVAVTFIGLHIVTQIIEKKKA